MAMNSVRWLHEQPTEPSALRIVEQPSVDQLRLVSFQNLHWTVVPHALAAAENGFGTPTHGAWPAPAAGDWYARLMLIGEGASFTESSAPPWEILNETVGPADDVTLPPLSSLSSPPASLLLPLSLVSRRCHARFGAALQRKVERRTDFSFGIPDAHADQRAVGRHHQFMHFAFDAVGFREVVFRGVRIDVASGFRQKAEMLAETEIQQAQAEQHQTYGQGPEHR